MSQQPIRRGFIPKAVQDDYKSN